MSPGSALRLRTGTATLGCRRPPGRPSLTLCARAPGCIPLAGCGPARAPGRWAGLRGSACPAARDARSPLAADSPPPAPAPPAFPRGGGTDCPSGGPFRLGAASTPREKRRRPRDLGGRKGNLCAPRPPEESGPEGLRCLFPSHCWFSGSQTGEAKCGESRKAESQLSGRRVPLLATRPLARPALSSVAQAQR